MTLRHGRLLACAVLILAFACKKAEPPPQPKAAPPPPPPPVAAAITVTGVDLGSAIGVDKRVTAATSVFKPTDSIYAAVTTSGSAPRATITAKFTFEDGQVVDESRQDVMGAGGN